MSETVQSASQTVSTALTPVLADLRPRPDAGKEPFLSAIDLLNSLKKDLAIQSPTLLQLQGLQVNCTALDQAINKILTANHEMMRMGQLNTKRLLMPETLKTHNDRLQALQTAVHRLLALLASTDGALPQAPDIKLPKTPSQTMAPPSKNLEETAVNLAKVTFGKTTKPASTTKTAKAKTAKAASPTKKPEAGKKRPR